MTYRIAAVSITDYKRVREIQITPDADRMAILIAGQNAQGKSSVLDAIEAALGGKAAVALDPVRHGADEATIELKLDGDEPLTVKRKIDPDGTTTLELRDAIGAAVRSPQAVLDKLIGARFLDPIAFLMLKGADQRAHLLALIDHDGVIAKLDGRRERVFDLRTEVNRESRKAAAELARVAQAAVEPVPPVDVSDLANQLQAVNDAVAALNLKRSQHENAEQQHRTARVRREKAEAALEAARRELEAASENERQAASAVEVCTAAVDEASAPAFDASTQRAAIQKQIADAQEFNRKAATDAATWKRKQEIETELQRLDVRSKQLTEEIEKVDTEKGSFLKAAKLPVDGLGVDSSGVLLNGAPLVQASGAEKQRVALALAIAANPNLRDVWIRDGALLDDNSLAAIMDQAAKAGVRVWIERVGERDPDAIVIHDGVIKPTAPPAQASLPL